MKNNIELTNKQGRHLLDLIDVSDPRYDTVGPRHNPTERTRAHVAPNTGLESFLKENGWLENDTVLVCHGSQCSDEFRIEHRWGKWTVSHIPVG